MKNNKMLEIIGFAVMILALVFNVISYIKTDDLKYVIGGVIVSLILLLNAFAVKKNAE